MVCGWFVASAMARKNHGGVREVGERDRKQSSADVGFARFAWVRRHGSLQHGIEELAGAEREGGSIECLTKTMTGSVRIENKWMGESGVGSH